MATKTLLSDNLWIELSRIFVGHKRICAAISYVTAQHLDFRAGDLLICDASNRAIKGGLTTASTLRSFFNKGAELYSFKGLHAKVAVIDGQALIGSANLSENAGVRTCEASLLTDDIQITGLIQGFIESVKRQSTPVEEKFLKRIEALPVVRTSGISRDSKREVKVGKSRVWFIATGALNERISNAEESFESKGRKDAETRIVKKGYEVYPVRWLGKSRFRLEAKPGDLVIEAFTKKQGSKKIIQVFHVAPILHRQDHERWTRFYLERPSDAIHYSWKDVKAYFERLGVSSVTSNSIRELTGKALGVLEFFK